MGVLSNDDAHPPMMRTYPIIDEKKGANSFAFEVENAYVRPRTIARLLKEVDGVTDVRVRKLFDSSADTHVQFKYLTQHYMVWEPYGDSSRYWIGPKHQQIPLMNRRPFPARRCRA